jgi:putative SOS response-associated peptidase YedK
MTRAYRLDAPSGAIAEAFGAQHGPDPWGGGDLQPGQFAPVIVRSAKTSQRVIRPMVWGYPAPNSVTASGDVQWVTTVRNVVSPFWIGNLRHVELRCLVPATAVTRHMPDGNVHSPPLFVMAGIWRDLTDMPVFAIISVDSDKHGKTGTPLVLDGPQQQIWLTATWKEAARLLEPHNRENTVCA